MINKKNFIDMVQEKVNVATEGEYSKKLCDAMITAVMDAISDVLTSGESVRFGGFGTFDISFRAGREGKSAFDGKAWKSNDTIVPRFKASKSLKETVAETYDPKKHKPKK